LPITAKKDWLKLRIVLLDILLPKLDGFAVLKAAKADSATKEIPIILFTNLGQKDEVKRGFEEGASDYLIKTHFKPSEIVDKVREVLLRAKS
jgi:two-component system, chemotaxis family, sensor kinase CheA